MWITRSINVCSTFELYVYILCTLYMTCVSTYIIFETFGGNVSFPIIVLV